MWFGLFFLLLTRLWSVGDQTSLFRLILNLIILTLASFAIAHYWESKRDGYFWRGFILSMCFGPIITVFIGFSFDRYDIFSFGSKKDVVLNELMIAAVKSKPNIIQNLVGGGAKVNRKTTTKRTALMIAAESNRYPQVCDILIRAGINVNDKDKYGMTALMYAAKNNEKTEVCEVLIRAGAEINTQDDQGATALMYAAYINSNPEIVSLLLKEGANPKITDKEGKTVFDYAYKLPNKAILESHEFDKLRKVTIVTPKL